MSRMRPACFLGGNRVVASIEINAPAEGIVRSRPKPTGPTCRMSVANTGSMAMAPPKKTANRSRAIEDSSTWWCAT